MGDETKAWRQSWDALGNFVLCFVLVGIGPLLPYGIEWVWHGSVSTASLTASSALYVIGLGGACKSKLPFTLFLVAGAGLAALFGVETRTLVETSDLAIRFRLVALAAIWGTLIGFAVDRFVYLYLFGEEFGPFGRSRP